MHRNRPINGNDHPDFLHQTATRQRRVPVYQPQVSLHPFSRYLQMITRLRTAAAMSRHGPATLLPIALGAVWDGSTQVAGKHLFSISDNP